MARLSGLQRQVLSLYRAFLRAARNKPSEARSQLEQFVAAEFRRNAIEVDKKDFQTIEYLLRRGNKQLLMLQGTDVNGFTFMEPRCVQQEMGDEINRNFGCEVQAGNSSTT
ncbi:hypothetical protein BDL97_01G106900 [Sphagnum fallax]|nr:hypothetical protein BDL97_01G106900 [Sphagnum fallax]